jgi:hypothetical protein
MNIIKTQKDWGAFGIQPLPALFFHCQFCYCTPHSDNTFEEVVKQDTTRLWQMLQELSSVTFKTLNNNIEEKRNNKP